MRPIDSLRSLALTLLVGFGVLCHSAAHAQRIKEMATIAGERPNQLVGYGLVVGLDGSGDTVGQAPFTGQSIVTMLGSLGVAIPPNVNIQPRNVAAVMITAELPPMARPGQTMDVTVSSIGNARSLRGGTLLMSPLRAANGQIYGQAQGSVSVGGVAVATRRASTTIGQQGSGRIPAGAFVEQAAPEGGAGPLVELNFKRADYAQTQRAVEAITRVLGPQSVLPVDARTVNVRVPEDPVQRMSAMAQLLEIEVPRVLEAAKVVINARTGAIVMNQSVQLLPFVVTYGTLTVRVQSTNTVIQPPAGSVLGRPATQRNDAVSVEQGAAGNLIKVEPGATLDDIVRALNRLGATPQELMGILQAMKSAGALQAELEII
jgi:flagellar P-ring protein precursor FlgI